MSAQAVAAGRVAIFSDEPGWHGARLRDALATLGLEAVFVPLGDCRFDIAVGGGLLIPGFGGLLPEAGFVRGIAGGSLEQITLRLDVLHALGATGVPVLNDARAIERTVDKAMTTWLLARAGVPTPPTWVCEDRATARARVETELACGHRLVCKPLFGSQGDGIVRLESTGDFENLAPAGEVYYLQRYVARRGGTYRDWRIFVIDGCAVAGMERASRHWVTNRAQGADCRPITANRELDRLAEAAAAALEVGYAGVDILRAPDGEWLVGEINGIPAWQGLQRASGVEIAPLLADALWRRVLSARGARVELAG